MIQIIYQTEDKKDSQMKKYSQNNEDQIVHDYFGIGKINVLSIGENDGKTLSNVLRAIEDGASALLIEPSEEAFKRLKELHKNNNRVHLLNLAISNNDGLTDFYESGDHLGIGDTSLLSTLSRSEVNRWKSSGEQFTKTKVYVATFSTIMELSEFKTFDLISIDAEGMDWDILKQINLKEIGCRMLIIECNRSEHTKFIDFCAYYGLFLTEANSENLIFTLIK